MLSAQRYQSFATSSLSQRKYIVCQKLSEKLRSVKPSNSSVRELSKHSVPSIGFPKSSAPDQGTIGRGAGALPVLKTSRDTKTRASIGHGSDVSDKVEQMEDLNVVRLKRKILVAIDRYDDSKQALNWVIDNLLRAGDEVHVVHLAPNEESNAKHVFSMAPSGNLFHEFHPRGRSSPMMLLRDTEQWARDICAQYGQTLASAQAQLIMHVLPERNKVEKKHVSKVLCKLADEEKVDVMVMCSRSNGGLMEWLTGSVADQIVKHSKRPVAVLHNKEKASKDAASTGSTPPQVSKAGSEGRKLLLTVDSSDDSLVACRWMLQHMYKTGDTVRLLHVIPCLNTTAGTLMADGLYGGYENINDLLKRANEEQAYWETEEVKRFKAVLEEAGADYKVDTMVECTEDALTSISSAICFAAKEVDASVVLLSHHHHPALMDFMLQSVSNRVAHHCTSPVLVLKGAEPVSQYNRGAVGAS